MGGPIDMEHKGYDSIGCWTHNMTLRFDYTYEHDHVFFKVKFWIWIH